MQPLHSLCSILLAEPTICVQAESLGLGSRWEKVKVAYANANAALGDIVKVRFPLFRALQGKIEQPLYLEGKNLQSGGNLCKECKLPCLSCQIAILINLSNSLIELSQKVTTFMAFRAGSPPLGKER